MKNQLTTLTQTNMNAKEKNISIIDSSPRKRTKENHLTSVQKPKNGKISIIDMHLLNIKFQIIDQQKGISH